MLVMRAFKRTPCFIQVSHMSQEVLVKISVCRPSNYETSCILGYSSTSAHLLLDPVQQLPALPPQSVHAAPGVDVPLPGHLQPRQVRVLLTDRAADRLLSEGYKKINIKYWNFPKKTSIKRGPLRG